MSPSPNEWADVLMALHEYLGNDQYALHIDGIYGTSLARIAGARKCLSTEASIESNLDACQERVVVLEKFISAME